MKAINKIIEWIVGGLFIFSGLIKINDPKGTAIKLKEYFEAFSLDLPLFTDLFEGLAAFALPIAVFMCVLEVVLGVSLLLNTYKKTTIISLGLMINFFTILTFYSAYLDRVTDCGCFGDAIKLTPWESFSKDVVLLLLILILSINILKLDNSRKKINLMIVSFATLLSTGIALYAIMHLPFIDFRPYKIGNNIEELRKQPKAACKFDNFIVMNGETIKYTDWKPEYAKADSIYAILLNEEECTPKIKDFYIYNEHEEYQDKALKGNQLIYTIGDLENFSENEAKRLKNLSDKIGDRATLIICTKIDNNQVYNALSSYGIELPIYSMDEKTIKTMIRSKLGLVLLQEGVVKGKWASVDMPTAEDFMDFL